MPETPPPDLPSTVVPDTPSPQPAGPPQGPRVGSDWLNQLRADQRLRWEQGERIPVEAYLEAYPALKSDPNSVLNLIIHEVQLRRQRQEEPSVADFVQRFPHHADPLRRHFTANTEPGSES